MAEASLASVAVPGGLVGGPFGSTLVGRDYVPRGVPVIRGGNLSQRYVGGDFVYVSPEKWKADLVRNSAIPGDIVFTQRGTLGQVSIVPDGELDTYVVSQSQMRLRVDPSIADPRFIYYACRSQQFMRQIDSRAIATGVPHINLGILSTLTVPMLGLPTQRAIAEVLGALDDKIAANDEVLRVSDQLVRARFDSLDDASAEDVPLSGVAENVRIQVDPAEIDPSAPYVGLEHVPRRNMWMSDIGVAGSVSSAKSRFRTGDVLFGKLRPYFHKVVRADRDGIASTDILVVRAKDPVLAGFVLAAASSDIAIRATSAAVEGTRMPRTKWADLAAVTVPWPGEAAAIDFSSQVAVLCDQAAALQQESRVLAETRDELLPLLMSGKVQVRDAEKKVEEVL